MVFIIYILFVILVTVLGSKRQIGGFVAFVISLFLSPLIGLVFVLISKELVEVYSIKNGKAVKCKEDDVISGKYIKEVGNNHCVMIKEKGMVNHLYCGDWNSCVNYIQNSL